MPGRKPQSLLGEIPAAAETGVLGETVGGTDGEIKNARDIGFFLNG